MEPLALDPGEYPGSYKLVGGRVSLDFVNTISWPDTDRQHDWLAIPSNVITWLEAVGVQAPSVGRADIPEVHVVRRIISDALRPIANGQHPSPAALERFNEVLARAQARRVIDPELGWAWRPPEDVFDLLAPVVADAADLITTDDHSRLKHCPSCDWLFEDQTRNGRRRWCDMADCGSRAKARTYYQRTKAAERSTSRGAE